MLPSVPRKRLEIGPQKRNLAGDLRGDDRSPISAVVPGQEISGQAVSQGEQEQNHAHHPGGLAGFLIGPEEEDLRHVEHHHHNHHARAPVVQAVDQAAPRDLGDDVLQAVVSIAGSGRVIEGE